MYSNNNQSLQTKVASLESQVDMLETELRYLNEVLVRVGFPEGIKTLKETVEELLIEDVAFLPQEKKRPSI